MIGAVSSNKRHVAKELWALLNSYQMMAPVDEQEPFWQWSLKMDNQRPFSASDISRRNVLISLAIEEKLLSTDYSNQTFASIRERLTAEAS